MRKTIISLVVAVASLVPACAYADGMPPEAKKSSPGTPASPGAVTMADLAADAPDSYTVVKGDTLWGIAGKFLKDPWKWPQVWNMNKDQIKDPHWIYPGDVIRLDRSGANPQLTLNSAGGSGASGGTAADAERNVVKLDPRVRTESLQTAIPSIPGAAIAPFLTQPLVMEAGAMDSAPTIVATEESRVIVGSGDTAYADRIGSDSAANWQVYRQGTALRDPETGELLGYEARYVADARVKRIGNPATLEILRARQEVNRGDRLVAAREVSFPSYSPRAPNKPIRGAIMSVDGGVSELGQFQVIAINRGARDGLEVGHVLASMRRGAVIAQPGSSRRWIDSLDWDWLKSADIKPNPVVPEPPRPAGVDAAKTGAAYDGGPITLPDERNGLIFIFRVFDRMSYGLVMRTTRPVYVGDVVQTP